MKFIIFLLLPLLTYAKIDIAVSSNAYDALKTISRKFTKDTKIKVNITTNSSGILYLQIKGGARSDLFFSADSKYPTKLYDLKIAKSKPYTYVLGKLIYITNSKSKNLLTAIKESKTIAMANKELAPYGLAAYQVLSHYKLFEKDIPKLLIGQNISTTTIFIIQSSKNGFTAKSMLHSKRLKNKKINYIVVDSSLYTPIKQDMVMLNNKKETKLFFKFIKSNYAKNVFLNYGYGIKSDNDR